MKERVGLEAAGHGGRGQPPLPWAKPRGLIRAAISQDERLSRASLSRSQTTRCHSLLPHRGSLCTEEWMSGARWWSMPPVIFRSRSLPQDATLAPLPLAWPLQPNHGLPSAPAALWNLDSCCHALQCLHTLAPWSASLCFVELDLLTTDSLGRSALTPPV